MRVVAAFAAALLAAACLASEASTSSGGTATSSRAIVAVTMPGSRALAPGESVPVEVTMGNDRRAVVGRVSSLPRGCRASWFRFEVEGRRKGDGGTARVSGRLEFRDTNTDQSACAGAELVLSVSVR
jgi:hypothetical protein